MAARSAALAMLLVPVVTAPMIGQVADRTAFARSVDSMATEGIRSGPVAGIAIGVAEGSNVILSRGYGFADLENRVQVTDSTVFRIGSITKQFTAAIVLQLVQEGTVSLDDSLGKFIPQFPTNGNRVLVRHLLNHTSGIKSYTSMGPRFWQRARLPMPLDTLIALLRGVPPDFKPGEKWSYNNSAYYLLGIIIERVTGKSYASNIEERLARPLGLTATRYCETTPLIAHRAQGYATASAGLMNAEFLDMSAPGAAGALCSSVIDLLKWQAALTGGRVISPSAYARMSTPDTLTSGERLTYAYGLGIGSLGSHPRINHGGGINGFTSHIAWFPEDSTTIVVLVNTQSEVTDQLTTRISRLALGVPAPQVTEMPLPRDAAAGYVGTYADGDYRVKVAQTDGRLVLEEPDRPADSLIYQGGSTFILRRHPEQRIVFSKSGARATSFVVIEDERTVGTLQRVE